MSGHKKAPDWKAYYHRILQQNQKLVIEQEYLKGCIKILIDSNSYWAQNVNEDQERLINKLLKSESNITKNRGNNDIKN